MRGAWILFVFGCRPEPPDPTDTGELATGDTGTPPTVTDCAPGTVCDDAGLCWVAFCGDTFEMGAFHGLGQPDEGPLRVVDVRAFEILGTEVTVEQYGLCVADGACVDPEASDPPPPSGCRDRAPDDPRGCLDWAKASDFCAWAGGRLPSEAEWEYAARSGGQERTFPWGDEAPDCALAMLGYTTIEPCGPPGPAPVCSRPAGDTEQGLCDMAGNIYEWVADWYHDDYAGAPGTSGAWQDPPGVFKVLRGGGINSDEPVTTTNRTFHEPEFTYSGSGVRCARDYRGEDSASR